ncbi:MAG: hypothetical protein PHC78_07410 [Verrucomicrobiota bacterium]|nr:hypothetical protein [Verrucomicrobiota bacterium]
MLYHKSPPERKVKRAGGSQTVSVWYPVGMGAAWSKVGAERLDESGIAGNSATNLPRRITHSIDTDTDTDTDTDFDTDFDFDADS